MVNHSNAVPHESFNRTQTSGNANSTEVSRSWNPLPLGSLWRLPSPAWVLQPEPHSFSETNNLPHPTAWFSQLAEVWKQYKQDTSIDSYGFFSDQKPHIRILTPQIRKSKWKIPVAHCHWHPMISFIWNPCLKGELSEHRKGFVIVAILPRKLLNRETCWTYAQLVDLTGLRAVSILTLAVIFRNKTYSTKQVSDQTCNTTKCQTCTSLYIVILIMSSLCKGTKALKHTENGVFLTQQLKHPSWGACGTSYQFRSTKSGTKTTKNIGSWSDNSLQETLLPVTFHDRHCRNRHFGHKVSNARAKQNTIEPFTWNIRGLPNGWNTDNCNRAETLCLLLKRWTCVSCVSAKRATSKGVAKPTFTNFPTFTIFAPLLGWLYLSA